MTGWTLSGWTCRFGSALLILAHDFPNLSYDGCVLYLPVLHPHSLSAITTPGCSSTSSLSCWSSASLCWTCLWEWWWRTSTSVVRTRRKRRHACVRRRGKDCWRKSAGVRRIAGLVGSLFFWALPASRAWERKLEKDFYKDRSSQKAEEIQKPCTIWHRSDVSLGLWWTAACSCMRCPQHKMLHDKPTGEVCKVHIGVSIMAKAAECLCYEYSIYCSVVN